MALTIEALAAAVIDLVLLRVMLRLENEPGADHPKERRWMLAAGVLLLVGCIAEIALRGAPRILCRSCLGSASISRLSPTFSASAPLRRKPERWQA